MMLDADAENLVTSPALNSMDREKNNVNSHVKVSRSQYNLVESCATQK